MDGWMDGCVHEGRQAGRRAGGQASRKGCEVWSGVSGECAANCPGPGTPPVFLRLAPRLGARVQRITRSAARGTRQAVCAARDARAARNGRTARVVWAHRSWWDWGPDSRMDSWVSLGESEQSASPQAERRASGGCDVDAQTFRTRHSTSKRCHRSKLCVKISFEQ